MADYEFITSAISLTEPSPDLNLARLLFHDRAADEEDNLVIMGAAGSHRLDISLRQLRWITLHVIEQLEQWKLGIGDTVCLVRLPRTSETRLAAVYAALSAAGLRVVLPMYLEPDAFGDWLSLTDTKAIFWSARTLLETNTHKADRVLYERLCSTASNQQVKTYCLDDDLRLPDMQHLPGQSPSIEHPTIRRLVKETHLNTKCLVLTTSGTSGRSKLVQYRQGAFIKSAISWELAGLFEPDKLGGRGLCLLFAHSMGIRAFWNAIWTRQATCLIPPEWVFEHPERVHMLLTRMRPAHVTGGPAVYRTLLELARLFPQLKDTCLSEMRCAVSSGAKFDPASARRIEGALGMSLQNAFGMTETMQLLSTVVDGPYQAGLGNLLPGVEVALQRAPDTTEELYRLLIKSPFGFDRYLGREDTADEQLPGPGWFNTGDLVKRTPAGLFHAGRQAQDFLKDSFGVKINHAILLKRYANLGSPVIHIECFPIREEPGLAAIIFVDSDQSLQVNSEGWIVDQIVTNRVKSLLEGRLEQLHRQLEDFEIRHLTVARFACVPGMPPYTVKGNVARSTIEKRYRPIIEQLTGHYLQRPGLERLNRERLLRSATAQFTKPEQGELLYIARLNKQYDTAVGDCMTYTERGKQHEVIDMAGGFGCTLLGHRHPKVVAAAQAFLTGQGVFLADQGSARHEEGEFARALALTVSRYTGASYIVRLGTTGSEAVEMALAHSFLEQRHRVRRFIRSQKRQFGHVAPEQVQEIEQQASAFLTDSPPVILAIEGSFHGASLGARSIKGRGKDYDQFHPLMAVKRILLPANGQVDVAALVEEMDVLLPALGIENGRVVRQTRRFTPIIAAIAEPIRGEGGVFEVCPALLHRLGQYQFPLILDEIQCGLGRSGAFLASEGIHADYYLLGVFQMS